MNLNNSFVFELHLNLLSQLLIQCKGQASKTNCGNKFILPIKAIQVSFRCEQKFTRLGTKCTSRLAEVVASWPGAGEVFLSIFEDFFGFKGFKD